jgi:hypothetical protein
LPNGLSVALIVLLAANYFGTFGDLDYTWQIRTGEIIVRTGDLQPSDHFTYTIAGKKLPDFEWLYDASLWLLWDHLGYGGLKLLKSLLVASTLLLVAWRLRVAGIQWRGIAFAMTIAVATLAPAWNLRPLYCSTIGLLVVSGWLHDHCVGRKPLPWWLPAVMLLWANTHPMVLMGQALLVGAIVWEWLNSWCKLNRPLDRPALRRLTAVAGLGLLATLVSPAPLERLLYPFRPEVSEPIQRVFVEMRPLYTTVTKQPYTSGFIYVVAAMAAVTVTVRFRQYRAWEIMLLSALTLLANIAARAAQDWLLIMLALTLPHAVELLRQQALRDRKRLWVRWALRLDSGWKRAWISPLLRFQWQWPTLAAALLAVLSLIPASARAMPRQDDDEWPRAALDFLEARGFGGNFFGPPEYGAYVTWRLGDRARCYADTRGFYFPAVVLEDSHYLPQLGPDWRQRMDRVLDEYRTDYFILETKGARGELWRSLQSSVGGDAIYQDEQTVVLTSDTVRRGMQSREVAVVPKSQLHRR